MRCGRRQETTLLREPNGNGYHRSKEVFPMPVMRHLSQVYTPNTTFFRLLPPDYQESGLMVCFSQKLNQPPGLLIVEMNCFRTLSVKEFPAWEMFALEKLLRQYLLPVPRAIPVLWRSCQKVHKVSDGGRGEEAFFLF